MHCTYGLPIIASNLHCDPTFVRSWSNRTLLGKIENPYVSDVLLSALHPVSSDPFIQTPVEAGVVNIILVPILAVFCRTMLGLIGFTFDRNSVTRAAFFSLLDFDIGGTVEGGCIATLNNKSAVNDFSCVPTVVTSLYLENDFRFEKKCTKNYIHKTNFADICTL